MRPVQFTLLSEGSSDRALIPLLLWTLQQHSEKAFSPQWAELRRLPRPLHTLDEKLEATLQLYPCDLLFVHRDADQAGREARLWEIEAALAEAPRQPAVAVVPVRAQETWLLFDEQAIRTAAGNPNGRVALELPPLATLERVSDPKRTLYELLENAKSLGLRRRRAFRPQAAVHRVAELIEDFSPLKSLPAYQAFEEDLKAILASRGWL